MHCTSPLLSVSWQKEHVSAVWVVGASITFLCLKENKQLVEVSSIDQDLEVVKPPYEFKAI